MHSTRSPFRRGTLSDIRTEIEATCDVSAGTINPHTPENTIPAWRIGLPRVWLTSVFLEDSCAVTGPGYVTMQPAAHYREPVTQMIQLRRQTNASISGLGRPFGAGFFALLDFGDVELDCLVPRNFKGAA